MWWMMIEQPPSAASSSTRKPAWRPQSPAETVLVCWSEKAAALVLQSLQLRDS